MKFNLYFRIALGISSLAVIASLYLPLWEIFLYAPQYPEGLSITIWYNDVKGDVDIINGLNHYIGMRHIKPEMFPEFTFLKYVLITFIILGVIVAAIGNYNLLKAFSILCILGGIIALADFYRWGYDYGHNLDPTAPINVPGMSYQPPVLGYKDLLNFRALSLPAIGGWLIVLVGIIALSAWAFEWIKKRKLSKVNAVASLLLIGFLSSCSSSVSEINFGKDDCDYCKMKIMDTKFGMAILTQKGKTFKFDDYHCYELYVKENNPSIQSNFVVAVDNPGKLIGSNQTFYVQNENIKSPMGSGLAFFRNKENIPILFPGLKESGKSEEIVHE
ncbi:MAG: hypothetical protein MH472_01425 [Bacteroidia bacterium]|nr:hypothetical protein [Bacteroidia bacterium]